MNDGTDNGIRSTKINDSIHDALAKTEFLDNVIRIASWNIYDDPAQGNWEKNKDEVCDSIRRIMPIVSVLL